MEGDHDEASPGRESPAELLQSLGERLKLAVHRDAQGLEYPRGGMCAPMPRQNRFHQLREFECRLYGALTPLGHNLGGDAPRRRFLAEIAENALKLLRAGVVHNVRRGRAPFGVHPHVESPLMHETEATRRRI